MTSTGLPDQEGHYWAKLVSPRDMPPGEDWASIEWEVVQVWDNNGAGGDKWRVSVCGVSQSQLIDDFEWGPRVPNLDQKAQS